MCITILFLGSSKSFQDNDSKQRKHLVRYIFIFCHLYSCVIVVVVVVRVSNGPMNRGVRGYNGSDNSKPHRKGGYPNSRNSRERRSIPQDRDNSLRGIVVVVVYV